MMPQSSKNLRLWCSLALVPIILSLMIAGYGRYKYNESHANAAPDGTEDWEPNLLEERRNARLEVLSMEGNTIELNLTHDDSLAQFLSPEYLEAEALIAQVRNESLETWQEDEADDEVMVDDEMLEMDDGGDPVIYDVSEGEWLASIAQKLYGHKNFWGYIYEVNRDLMKSPDDVKAGMELYLPNQDYFGIDSTNTQSIQRAAAHSAAILNKRS